MSDLNLAAYSTNEHNIDLPFVSRIEVITTYGREYVLMLNSPGAHANLQDDGRTLKIFVNE